MPTQTRKPVAERGGRHVMAVHVADWKRMMMFRSPLTLAAATMATFGAVACSSSNNSTAPSNSSFTASVTVPRPSQPAANATVRFVDQPVVLGVQNAALTSTSGNVYTFEVATDPAFVSKVQTKDNISEGTNGQTTAKLDSLAGGKDYYWHARATGGGTTGPFSAPAKFTMGAAVVLNAPEPIGPLNGTSTSPRPTLRVTNSTRSGPTGAITYLFEIATSSAFTSIVLSATRAEGVNETAFTPNGDLPLNTTLYWRATASDASNSVSSSASRAQSFSTRPLSQAEAIAQQLGVVLWPGAQPPGTFGHATMGDDPNFGVGWGIQTLHYGPQDVYFQSPDVEMLRFFDLFDRGFDPDGAIGWMNSNGYPTAAQWYPPPEKAVLGLHYVYIAARGKVVTNAIWDLVLRVE